MTVRVPTSQHGETALHWAAEHGAVDTIDELVRRGANVDAMTGTASCNNPPYPTQRPHTVTAHTPRVRAGIYLVARGGGEPTDRRGQAIGAPRCQPLGDELGPRARLARAAIAGPSFTYLMLSRNPSRTPLATGNAEPGQLCARSRALGVDAPCNTTGAAIPPA